MSSGDTLLVFSALSCDPIVSSENAYLVPHAPSLLEFEASAPQSTYFTAVMPQHYRGGDLEVVLFWFSASADTAQRCRWGAAIDRVAADAPILNSGGGFAAAVEQLAAPSATESGLRQTTLTIPAAAGADNLEAGDFFRLKIYRAASHASDTLADMARLAAVELREA